MSTMKKIKKILKIIPIAILSILCRSFYQWLFGCNNITLVSILFTLDNLSQFASIVLGIFTTIEIWNYLEGDFFSRLGNFLRKNFFTAYRCDSDDESVGKYKDRKVVIMDSERSVTTEVGKTSSSVGGSSLLDNNSQSDVRRNVRSDAASPSGGQGPGPSSTEGKKSIKKEEESYSIFDIPENNASLRSRSKSPVLQSDESRRFRDRSLGDYSKVKKEDDLINTASNLNNPTNASESIWKELPWNKDTPTDQAARALWAAEILYDRVEEHIKQVSSNNNNINREHINVQVRDVLRGVSGSSSMNIYKDNLSTLQRAVAEDILKNKVSKGYPKTGFHTMKAAKLIEKLRGNIY